MALAKFGIVLAVFLTATHGHRVDHQDATESKHRALGYRPPAPVYYTRQQGPHYGIIHHARRQAPHPIGYGQSQRPSGFSHRLQPAHAVAHVHHRPAYRVPYRYANPAPLTATYPVPLALRPRVTPTTPMPIVPPPVHASRPSYSPPNYVAPQVQRTVHQRPPVVGAVRMRAPSVAAAPTPPAPKRAPALSAGHSLLDLPWVKPLYARQQVAPKVNYYATPSTWWRQQFKPTPAIVEQDTGVSISNVRAPTAGSLPSPVTNVGAVVGRISQDATAFNVPEPVVPAPAQRPMAAVIISDDSDEDIRVIQEVTTPASLRRTPIVVLDESNEVPVVQRVPVSEQRVSLPPAEAAGPATLAVELDNSDEEARLANVRQESVLSVAPLATSLPTPPSRVSLAIADDSVEDVRIVQPVQPTNIPLANSRPRTPAAPPLVVNTVEDLALRVDLPSVSATSPAAARPQSPTVPNVPVAGLRSTPTVTPASLLVLFDQSDEDVEFRAIAQPSSGGPSSSASNAGTRTSAPLPLISVSVSEDSEEDFRLVQVQTAPASPSTPLNRAAVSQSTTGTASLAVGNQGATAMSNVPVANVRVSPPRLTTPGTSSFTLLETTSDEEVVLRDIPQDLKRPSSPGAMQFSALTVVDDSLEDVRIVQQVPVSNSQVSRPSASPGVSFVVLDRSQEDVRNSPGERMSLPSGSASGPTTRTPSLALAVSDLSEEDVPIVRLVPPSNGSLLSSLTIVRENSLEVADRSTEDFEFKFIPQAASVATLSSPGAQPSATAALVLSLDSDEEMRTVQELGVLNVSSPGGAVQTRLLFLEDSAEDIQTSRRIPQSTVSLPGSRPSATAGPVVTLAGSAEDARTIQEIRLPTISSTGSVAASPLLFLRDAERDSDEDIEISRGIARPAVSLPGSLPSAAAGPVVRLVDSDEEIQIGQEIRLLNVSSSAAVGEDPLLFFRDSDEDIQIGRRIAQPTVSLAGPAQAAAAAPLLRLMDSDQDVQLARQVPPSGVLLTAPVAPTARSSLAFLVDSEEDVQIVQGDLSANVPFNGPAPTGPLILLKDSVEDTQQLRRTNASLLSTTNSAIVLVDSDEDVRSAVSPLLQSANRVPFQETERGDEDDEDDSDEEIRRRLTLAGGSIVFVNPTVL